MKWSTFVKKYPNYEPLRFIKGENDEVKFLFNGDEVNPFTPSGELTKKLYHFPSYEGHTYTPENIDDFLYSHDKTHFPLAFLPLKISPRNAYPIPSISFSEMPIDITPLLQKLRIYITPSSYFESEVRNIFTNCTLTHKSSKEAKRWLAGPNYQYWPQQLSFAVWAATSGCGISITDTAMKSYPPVIQGLLLFHVYYTIRRILYQMGAALPGENTFSTSNNPYSKPALDRLLAEFGVKNEDFRFHGGYAKGLGEVYLNVQGKGIVSLYSYMPGDHQWPGFFKFPDENPKVWNRMEFMRNNQHHGSPYNWFAATKGKGLTQPGLARLNRSIETLTYCILTSQARSRTSIAGSSGGAIETRQIFQKLVEDSISEDTTSAINRFQKAVTDANCRLNLVISPNLWLMPSSVTINKESVQGYNNVLRRATSEMSFGVNKDINLPKKEHKNLPNHQTPMETHHNIPTHKKPLHPNPVPHKPKVVVKNNKDSHNTKLATVAIVSAGVGWWLFR